MKNLTQFALQMLQNNPRAANSDLGKQFAQILQSGDAKAGEQLANDILGKTGRDREQALKEASSFFHF